VGPFVFGIVLIVLGIAVFFLAKPLLASLGADGGFVSKRKPPVRVIGALLIVVGAAIPVASMVRIISATDVGIPTTFGKVGDPLLPGFHLVAPWTEVTTFSTRLQVSDMTATPTEGDRAGDDSVNVLASEGGSLNIDVTVRYTIAPDTSAELFRRVRTMVGVRDIIVRPTVRSQMRNVYSRYTAEEGYTTKREAIEKEVNEVIRPIFEREGLILDAVQVRDIRPAQQIIDAINKKLEASQAAERAEIEQLQALTEAETRRQVAETDKQARVIAAEGEAQANQILQDSLTPELLRAREIEAIANNGNTVLYPYGQPINPFIDTRGTPAPPATTPPTTTPPTTTPPTPGG
jgi:regulator of protease activity HflC (stomatin/prohibitin superfamily)